MSGKEKGECPLAPNAKPPTKAGRGPRRVAGGAPRGLGPFP
jgi:hypothetical protein